MGLWRGMLMAAVRFVPMLVATAYGGAGTARGSRPGARIRAAGRFMGGPATYDAANGGVTYAPFHDAAVPAAFSYGIEEVRQGLADGRISTGVDPATGQLG